LEVVMLAKLDAESLAGFLKVAAHYSSLPNEAGRAFLKRARKILAGEVQS
jgi:hypothetical protein